MTKDFHIREFKCKDGTQVPDHLIENAQRLANQLQTLRDHIGIPIHINSAFRSEKHNLKIGGSPKSQHKLAKAADIVTNKYSPKQLANIIEKLIKEGKMLNGGIGIYKSFVHYDIGPVRRWQL